MARPRQDFAERFWNKVDKNGPDGCWIWKGSIGNTDGGYGRVSLPGRPPKYKMAHRVAYEFVKGPIPEGMELHHKCRIRDCVNPDHLEPIEREEHRKFREIYIAPSRPPRAKPHALKDVCSGCGNPYDYFHNGKRYCLTCIKERQRKDPNRKAISRESKRRIDAAKKAQAIADGTYRPPGSAPGEKRGGGPKKDPTRTPEKIREQNRLKMQRWRAKHREASA